MLLCEEVADNYMNFVYLKPISVNTGISKRLLLSLRLVL